MAAVGRVTVSERRSMSAIRRTLPPNVPRPLLPRPLGPDPSRALPPPAAPVMLPVLSDLPTAHPADAGLDAAFLDGPLARLLGAASTRAAVLVAGGRVVWERYWDGYGPGSRFDTFSIAKA